MEKNRTEIMFAYPGNKKANEYQITPEGTLDNFMNSLQDYVDKYQEGLTHEQQKRLIRHFCLHNAEVLKCSETDARNLSMFFFSMLYEDPEKAIKMWSLLYQISENSLNQAIVIECFTELLTLNDGDTTMLWRIVHGIVRGYYEVKSLDLDDDEVFYTAVPEDSKARVVDPIRQKQSGVLKSMIDDSVMNKPIPDTSVGFEGLSKQEIAMFRKVYQFLQDDSDFLVSSDASSQEVNAYFIGKIKKLGSFVKELGLQTDRRKLAYKKFLDHALKSYIKPLFEYCKTLKEKRKNAFAEDIFFETILTADDLFTDSINAPTTEILDDKWHKLLKNINEYVHDNATLAFIPALPILPEIEELNRAVDDAFDFAEDATPVSDPMQPPISATIFKRPMLTAEIPGSDLAELRGEPAARVNALIDEEKLPLKETGAKHHKLGNLELATTAIKIPVAFGPGSEMETTILPDVKKLVDKLFFEYESVGVSLESVKILQQQLQGQIIDKMVKTPLLRKEFAVALLDQVARIRKKHSPIELTLLYRMLRVMFSNLVLNPPYSHPKNYMAMSEDTRLEAQLMTENELKVILKDIPMIINNRGLVNFMSNQETYDEVFNVEKDLRKIALEQAGKLGIHTELHELTFKAPDPKEALNYKVQTLEALCKSVKSLRKKVEGNWASRKFTWMWRDKGTREDMKIYFDKLEKLANELWQKCVAPGIANFIELKYSPSLEPSNK